MKKDEITFEVKKRARAGSTKKVEKPVGEVKVG
jgi:hypothetical protein